MSLATLAVMESTAAAYSGVQLPAFDPQYARESGGKGKPEVARAERRETEHRGRRREIECQGERRNRAARHPPEHRIGPDKSRQDRPRARAIGEDQGEVPENDRREAERAYFR